MRKRLTSFSSIQQKYGTSGFTLTELLIAVAIMGLLVIIAMPRFGNMLRKARESTSKGNLGVLRSAITIYYSHNEGIWPWQLANLGPLNRLNPGPGPPASLLDLNNNALVPDYIDKIPSCYTGQGVAWGTGVGNHKHEGGNWLRVSDSGIIADHTLPSEWLYFRDTGEVCINCTLTDLKGNTISTW